MFIIFRSLGWCAVAVIAALSLVPGQVRPHVLATGQYEHFAAYLTASAVLVLGYRDRANTILIALLLSGFSGVVEILQMWIPGRHSQLMDITFSSFGACTGIVIISVALSFLSRSEPQSS